MTVIEHAIYGKIPNLKDYDFYLMRQCSCTQEWKVIGVKACVESKEILKRFRQLLPAKEINPDLSVTLYSPEK